MQSNRKDLTMGEFEISRTLDLTTRKVVDNVEKYLYEFSPKTSDAFSRKGQRPIKLLMRKIFEIYREKSGLVTFLLL